jgi:hypothetical protein
MRLVATPAATLLALLLCLVCLGAGFTDLPIEDADLSVAIECSLGGVPEIAGELLAAPTARVHALYTSYDARLFRVDLARVKRWGS